MRIEKIIYYLNNKVCGIKKYEDYENCRAQTKIGNLVYVGDKGIYCIVKDVKREDGVEHVFLKESKNI